MPIDGGQLGVEEVHVKAEPGESRLRSHQLRLPEASVVPNSPHRTRSIASLALAYSPGSEKIAMSVASSCGSGLMRASARPYSRLTCRLSANGTHSVVALG